MDSLKLNLRSAADGNFRQGYLELFAANLLISCLGLVPISISSRVIHREVSRVWCRIKDGFGFQRDNRACAQCQSPTAELVGGNLVIRNMAIAFLCVLLLLRNRERTILRCVRGRRTGRHLRHSLCLR